MAGQNRENDRKSRVEGREGKNRDGGQASRGKGQNRVQGMDKIKRRVECSVLWWPGCKAGARAAGTMEEVHTIRGQV